MGCVLQCFRGAAKDPAASPSAGGDESGKYHCSNARACDADEEPVCLCVGGEGGNVVGEVSEGVVAAGTEEEEDGLVGNWASRG